MNETFMNVIQYIYLIIGLLAMMSLTVCPILMLVFRYKVNNDINDIANKYDKEINELTKDYEKRLFLAENEANVIKEEYQNMVDDIHYKPLEYTELNTIVDDIVNELWSQKYQMNYLLRGVDVIPDMTNDIAEMAREVVSSINQNLWANIDRYYDRAYFGSMITRKVEILFIEYTNRHKPPSK